MSRRKVQHIALKQVERCTEVYLALKEDPIFEGYDLSTLSISVKANITPIIRDLDRVTKNLEHYLAANPDCCDEFQGKRYTTKQQLAKMLRVSRTTLDKWIEDELITPMLVVGSVEFHVFDPDDILLQLQKQKE